MKKIFRKKALEKLSTPEQLQLLIRVIPQYSWVSLLSVILILIMGGVWSILGRISTGVKAPCLFYNMEQEAPSNLYSSRGEFETLSPRSLTAGSNIFLDSPVKPGNDKSQFKPDRSIKTAIKDNLKVYLFVNDVEAKKIKPNMSVLIDTEEDVMTKNGYIMGQVESIHLSMQNEGDLKKENADDFMERLITNSRYKVAVQIQRDSSTKKIITSTGQFYEKPILSGSTCHASIVLKNQAPFRYIFPYLLSE